MTSYLVWCSDCREEYAGVSVIGAYAFIGQHRHPYMVVLAEYEDDLFRMFYEAEGALAG